MINFGLHIVAGTVLVIDSIQSPNFSTGLSGWIIRQDGSVEFANATIRGVFEADGANGSYVRVTTTGGTGFGTAVIYLRPPDLPNINSSEITPGSLSVLSNQPGGAGVVPSAYLQTELDCVSWTFGSTAANIRYPSLVMRTASHDGTVNPSATLTVGGAASVPLNFDVTIDGNLTVNGKFSMPNCVLSYQGTPVATGGAPTVVNATGVLQDSSSMFNGTSGIVVPYTGEYEVGCCVEYQGQAVAAGLRDFRFQVNAADVNHWHVPTTASFNNTSITVTGLQRLKLTANDLVEFKAFQNSGAALNLQGISRGWVELKQRTA